MIVWCIAEAGQVAKREFGRMAYLYAHAGYNLPGWRVNFPDFVREARFEFL